MTRTTKSLEAKNPRAELWFDSASWLPFNQGDVF